MMAMSGELDKINALKPVMTERRYSALMAFNRLSQERRLENGAPMPITMRAIFEYMQYSDSCGYPSDLFVEIISKIDAKYIEMRCEEIRRKTSK